MREEVEEEDLGSTRWALHQPGGPLQRLHDGRHATTLPSVRGRKREPELQPPAKNKTRDDAKRTRTQAKAKAKKRGTLEGVGRDHGPTLCPHEGIEPSCGRRNLMLNRHGSGA